MVSFVSTRGSEAVTFRRALVDGLAPDGGLYLPADVPPLLGAPPSGDDPDDLRAVARWAGAAFLGAEAEGWLEPVVDEALDFPVPLRRTPSGRWILELFHGPTLAFKDVGARFMARAMAATDPADVRRTVLVATSGDTGSAVADAFHGRPGYRVVALFPRHGVAERQRKQMTTLGGNVTAAAVDGTFDDCQRMVKEAFADPALREDHGLTSANSINVGRLIPQAFYYLHAAARLGWDTAPPTFVVPSGNLGNLCAGLLAHRAGMPAAGFVAASNRNRTFVDYLADGSYRPRPSVTTPSNAMDVGAPSNLERIRRLFGDDLTALRSTVAALPVDDADTLRTMRRVHEDEGVLLDPHTAVAWAAADRLHTTAPGWATTPPGPVVILATAHPAKFPDTVREAVGMEPDLPPALADALARDEQVRSISPELTSLRSLLDELSRS